MCDERVERVVRMMGDVSSTRRLQIKGKAMNNWIHRCSIMAFSMRSLVFAIDRDIYINETREQLHTLLSFLGPNTDHALHYDKRNQFCKARSESTAE